MELFFKIIFSTTLIYLINFTVKTFTSSKFDKLFIPKHQKVLQNFIVFIFLFIVFIVYGIFLAALYGELSTLKYTERITDIIIWFYLLEIFLVLILCLIKYMAYKGKKRRRIVFNVKFLFPLLFSTILLDIIVHSITLWGIINVSTTKQDFIANMISNIITFFGIAYILIKCLQYLLDLNKRKWVYVLSPMPIDINQKYLEVLYSLTPTLLVLAEKNDDPKDPKSVYLYDITKNTYTYFQKVVQLKK